MYKVTDIAKNVLFHANKMGIKLNTYQLMQVIYYAQKDSLRYENTPLFSEHMYARPGGVIIADIFDEYEDYLSTPIPTQNIKVTKKVDKSTSGYIKVALESFRLNFFPKQEQDPIFQKALKNPDSKIITHDCIFEYFRTKKDL